MISPVGMEDTLVIDIEPICECGCSEEGSEGYDFTSEHCDYHGEETSVIIEDHCYHLRKPCLWRMRVL